MVKCIAVLLTHRAWHRENNVLCLISVFLQVFPEDELSAFLQARSSSTDPSIMDHIMINDILSKISVYCVMHTRAPLFSTLNVLKYDAHQILRGIDIDSIWVILEFEIQKFEINYCGC